MQRSTPCTELWNIRHKEKEKESRKIVQGKAENKKKKKNHHLLFTGMVRISQQLPLKILMLDESNDKLSTACQ